MNSTATNGSVLRLVLKYRTPSLNVTKRQHWAVQFKEKQKAFDALASALLATGYDRSIQTTSPEVSRICLMGLDTLGYYRATSRGGSASKQIRSKSKASKKNAQ